MAVYTKLSESILKDFFSKYNLGKILNYSGITEGIENTNYFIQTEKGKLGNFVFQAVTICYSGLNGLPISRSQRPIVAWWGNMNLFSHLWNVFSLSSINITVTAHEPIQNVQDRKSMSKIAWKQVAYGMGNALSGHPNPVKLEKIVNG